MDFLISRHSGPYVLAGLEVAETIDERVVCDFGLVISSLSQSGGLSTPLTLEDASHRAM
jgi:hypothetical protein